MTTLPSPAPATAMRSLRVAFGVAGALGVLFGVLILLWPGRVAIVLTLLVGIYAVAGGLVMIGIGVAVQGLSRGSRTGHLVLGVLYVAAGVAVFVDVAAALAFLAGLIGIAIGIVWIVEGVVALSTISDSASRGWTVLFAIASILAGIALVFSPIWGVSVLWWIVGVGAVVLGALQIARAVRWGRG